MAEVLRGVLSFDSVHRGPGQLSNLPRFQDKADPVLRYAEDDAQPVSMIINYNEPA